MAGVSGLGEGVWGQMDTDQFRRSPAQRRIRLVLWLTVPLLFSLLSATPARAASLVLSESSAAPGESIEVLGLGFEADSSVRLCWDDENCANLGRANTAEDGTFSATVEIPGDASRGTHEISACQTVITGLLCAWANITVEEDSTTTTTTLTATTTTTTATATTTTATTTTEPTTTTTTSEATTTTTTSEATASTTNTTEGRTSTIDPTTRTTIRTLATPDDPTTTESVTSSGTPQSSTSSIDQSKAPYLAPSTTEGSPLGFPPGAFSNSFGMPRDTPDTQAREAEVLSRRILPNDAEAAQPHGSSSDVNWAVVGGLLILSVVMMIWIVRYVLNELRR
jgi:hypothetical protein